MSTNPRLLAPIGGVNIDYEEEFDDDEEEFNYYGEEFDDNEGCFGERHCDEFGDHVMETTNSFVFNRELVQWVRIDGTELFTLSLVNGGQLRVSTLDDIRTNLQMFLPSGYAVYGSDQDQNGLITQSPEAQRRDIEDYYYIYMFPRPAVLTRS
jgi:hypothetical protein